MARLTSERRFAPPPFSKRSASWTFKPIETAKKRGPDCQLSRRLKLDAMPTEKPKASPPRSSASEMGRYSLLQHMPGFVGVLAGPTHVFEYVNDAYVATAILEVGIFSTFTGCLRLL